VDFKIFENFTILLLLNVSRAAAYRGVEGEGEGGGAGVPPDLRAHDTVRA